MSQRIAINGRDLDKVKIREPKTSPNTLSYVSFSAHRHSVRVDGHRATLAVQALAVVQLDFEGRPWPRRVSPSWAIGVDVRLAGAGVRRVGTGGSDDEVVPGVSVDVARESNRDAEVREGLVVPRARP